jgi:hypothetical protein
VVEWAPHGVAAWPLRQKESTGHALHLDTNDSSASRTSADHRSAANNGTHSVTAEAPAALVRPAAQATVAVSPAHQEPASHAARHATPREGLSNHSRTLQRGCLTDAGGDAAGIAMETSLNGRNKHGHRVGMAEKGIDKRGEQASERGANLAQAGGVGDGLDGAAAGGAARGSGGRISRAEGASRAV